MARAGEAAAPAAVPKRAAAASPAAAQAANMKAVIASDWKVVSFQKATALATLAVATAAAVVARNRRPSWAGSTPPKRPARAKIGTAATRRRITRSRLPASLPRTS